MENSPTLVDVHPGNIEKTGFFCCMSKKKSRGYQDKLAWFKQQYELGLRIRLLEAGGRNAGFIETIPGEHAWRAVSAPGFLFIHCLWVVGKAKGQGFGKLLLDTCLEEARAQGYAGAAVLTSDRVWLAHPDLFRRAGFEQTGEAAPFRLLAHRFPGSAAPDPCLPSDWEARATAFGPGLAVVHTPQCPYLDDAANAAMESAAELGIPARVVELSSAEQVQAQSPTPYGVFSVVLDGRLVTSHYQLKKDLLPMLGGS